METHDTTPLVLQAASGLAALNAVHAGELAIIATVVGILSVVGWRAAGAMRSWGVAFSRLAMLYAIVSFTTASLLVALMIMDHTGMDHAVRPIADFLSKFEAGLSTNAAG